MKIEAGPVAVVIVVVLLIVGGIWFMSTNSDAGKPAAGQAGRSDPMLSGPNSVMKGGIGKRQDDDKAGARGPVPDGGTPGAPAPVPEGGTPTTPR